MPKQSIPLILVEGPLTQEAILSTARNNNMAPDDEATHTIARLILTNEINSIDSMTGLWKRDIFLPYVATKPLENENATTVLVLMDLVGLGAINDLGGGQHAGNEVLKRMAKMFTETFNSEEDVNLARLGGDEFGLAYTSDGATSSEDLALDVIERISKTHSTYPDVAPIRLWYTEVKSGDKEKDFMPAADPKQKGLIPLVSYPDRLVRERISSKDYLHQVSNL